MRPLILLMSAFGPFAKQETIDFQKLGDNPLFLINGPTGAGKTTILDAICFALYGETTGIDRQARDMRCDYAIADNLTFVEFTFQLSDKCYKISRIPEQLRDKKHGDGQTTQIADVNLWQIIDGEKKLLVSRKAKEVNTEIINLTGLSADQFRQVMVLPQGKFRELLTASSQDREAIFRKLFETQIYTRLEQTLRERANELQSEIRKRQQQRNGMLDVAGIESIEELSTRIATLKLDLDSTKLQLKQSEKDYSHSQKALTNAKQLQNEFKSLEKAKVSLTGLLSKATEFDQIQLQLALLKQTSLILPHYQSLQSKIVELKTIDASILTAAEKSQQAEDEFQKNQLLFNSLDEQRQLLDTKKQNILQLESFKRRSDDLNVARVDFQKQADVNRQLITDLEKSTKRYNMVATALNQATLQRETVQVTAQKHAMSLVTLDKLKSDITQLEKMQSLESQHKQFIEKNSRLEKESKKKYELLLKQEKHTRKMENIWQCGQAALLAFSLNDGEACLVCGSEHHPLPAKADEDIPDDSILDEIRQLENKARQSYQLAQDELRQAQQNSLHIGQQITEMKQLSIYGIELTLLQQQLQRLQAEIVLQDNAVKMLIELEKSVSKMLVECESLNHNIQIKEQSLFQQKETLAAVKATLASKESELPEEYRQTRILDASIADNRNHIVSLGKHILAIETNYQQSEKSKIIAITQLTEMNSTRNELRNALEKLTDDWDIALQKTDIADEIIFIGLKTNINNVGKMEKKIRKYQDECLLAKQKLLELEVKLKEKQAPDIDAIITAEKLCKRQRDDNQNNLAKLTEKMTAYRDILKKLDSLQQKFEQLEEKYAILGRVNDVTNGKNPHKLSLQRFVLSVLLDDILIEASYRLSKMSKGRYQLLRRRSVTDRRISAGLDLDVEDTYNGKVRSVATLSGGESFMAALSLALGLSDVVQAYAGGIYLDTLFIDEGFGSLDAESLGLAIDTLIELQAAGRMIGIISHVPELKERIDVRLDIIAGKQGSAVKLVS